MLPMTEEAVFLEGALLTRVYLAPSRMVRISPYFRPRRQWCGGALRPQVTVVPDVSSSSVFNSGRCQGSKVSMPFGGQMPPNSASRVACTGSPGNSAELKNAQNQATKNITSEAMNRIMP